MIEEGIYSLLSTETSITALVVDRVYPVIMPTGSLYPCLTYSLVGGQSKQTLTTSGAQKRRLQIDCWAKDYLTAALIRETIADFLNGYRGTLSDGTYLQNVEYIQPLDFYSGGDELFRCGLEMYLYFNLH